MNPWVTHVKKVAEEKGISYRQALKVAKETYGGATVIERGEASRVREKYQADKVIVPPEYRAPLERSKNAKLSYYMNSVVHDDTDAPVSYVRIHNRTYPYSPDRLQNLIMYTNRLPASYIRQSWIGY